MPNPWGGRALCLPSVNQRRGRVIAHKNLRERVLASPFVLESDAIEQLHALARRLTTWAT